MDWKKEAEFQKGQFLGTFAGLGEEIKMTLTLMAMVMPPVLGFILLMDLVRLIA